MAARRTPDQRTRALAMPLELPGATLTHPFGEDVNVYKMGIATATDAGTGRHAGGKLFALIGLWGDPGVITLKVDPEVGPSLIAEHAAIEPGYHMNKRHWISVTLDGSVPDTLLRELVEDSYDLVLSTLSARQRFDVDPDRFPLPSRAR
jgi:predicted DNA-binding protein (MmcQ/YjbR family)